MDDLTIGSLTTAIAAAQTSDKGFRMEVGEDYVLVGFWFEAATGRAYVCGRAPTFGAALAKAQERRLAKQAEAEIEAEVRAEVAARMQAAA